MHSSRRVRSPKDKLPKTEWASYGGAMLLIERDTETSTAEIYGREISLRNLNVVLVMWIAAVVRARRDAVGRWRRPEEPTAEGRDEGGSPSRDGSRAPARAVAGSSMAP